MKSWPPLPVREPTIIPQRLPLKQATPDISWGRRSRLESTSWRDTSAMPREFAVPREGDHSAAANRRSSRLSVTAGLPLKPASDWRDVDGRDKNRKPTIMVIWVMLLVFATVALLLFSYEKEKKQGLVLRGGTASEDDAVPDPVVIVNDPVNATRGHPNPRPSPHRRITRRTSLHEATAATKRLASSVMVTTEDEMTSTSSEWEPPLSGTNATALNVTGG